MTDVKEVVSGAHAVRIFRGNVRSATAACVSSAATRAARSEAANVIIECLVLDTVLIRWSTAA